MDVDFRTIWEEFKQVFFDDEQEGEFRQSGIDYEAMKDIFWAYAKGAECLPYANEHVDVRDWHALRLTWNFICKFFPHPYHMDDIDHL